MRYNIFDKNGNLIGQDYQRDNGNWSHKWFSSRDNSFERGSWPWRAEGREKEDWKYIAVS